MRVSAPWIRKVILDDADDGNYVIANMNSVVLGGTHQHDDWDRVKIIWFVFIALINAIHKFAIFHLNYKIDCFQFYIGVRPGMARVGQGIFQNIGEQQGWQKTKQGLTWITIISNFAKKWNDLKYTTLRHAIKTKAPLRVQICLFRGGNF